MDRIPMTEDEIARAEQSAADEDAEVMYRQMCDDAEHRAELAADTEAAERAYRQMQA